MQETSPRRLPEVYQWLIASRHPEDCRHSLPVASLAIEDFGTGTPPLGLALAAHLSEYECECGHWLALDAGLMATMRDDISCFRLLGERPETGTVTPLETLLARRGHLIFEGAGMLQATAAAENTFRVALIREEGKWPSLFHLAADPREFDPGCLVAVIGDAFLEWMYCRESHASENPRSLR